MNCRGRSPTSFQPHPVLSPHDVQVKHVPARWVNPPHVVHTGPNKSNEGLDTLNIPSLTIPSPSYITGSSTNTPSSLTTTSVYPPGPIEYIVYGNVFQEEFPDR